MNSLFDDLVTGLTQAIEYEKGNLEAKKYVYVINPVEEYSNIEIKEIRKNAHMTQSVFAEYMGVSIKTVEAWEGGRIRPSGTARRLLSILASGIIVPFAKVTNE